MNIIRDTLSRLLVILCFSISLNAVAETINLTAFLDGDQASAGAGTGSAGTGTGMMSFDTTTSVLSWSIEWQNLTGNASALHFHGPAAPGVNAGVQQNIGIAANPAVGSAVLTSADAADLLAGLWYINLHTTTNGGGEIRGQVLVSPEVYISPSNPGNPVGVGFSYFDEDIIVHDGASWSMYFDGSDVGLGGPPDLNAFHLLDDGDFLLSFDTPVNLGGTLYDDSDIVLFSPLSLGNNTSGFFSLYYDGSANGLDTIGEDIDAITVNAAGELVISTLGSAQIPRGALPVLTQQDDDLARRRNSDGFWFRYFDGSDVGLTFATEDVWGAHADKSSGVVYLTTLDNFVASTLMGDGNDIFSCTPGTLGNNTSCVLELFWDGDHYGLTGERIDALVVRQD